MAAPRPLTPREEALKIRFFAGEGRNYGADDFLPNDGFITNVLYDSPWYNNYFKEFMAAGGTDNHNLEMLNRYEVLISTLAQTDDKVKKELSVRNRKRELLVNAYYLQYPLAVPIDKVVCCIIRRADGFALYVNNSSNGKLGFPKGDIEYSLAVPADITTVRRESPVEGALRELYEETGFQSRGMIDFSQHPHLFRLEYSGDVLDIVNSKAVFQGDVFYLALFTEANTALLPDVPQSARQENIDSKRWNRQPTNLTKNNFNVISQKTFQYTASIPHRPEDRAVQYLGGRRTRKRTDKRKQKKRKPKSKTRVVRRKY